MFTRDRDRRDKILEFVRAYADEHGFAPSIREIGKAVGIRSTKAVKYHLDILAGQGLLKRTPRQARGLSTAHQPDTLPLIGRIAAGSPLLAVENVEAQVSLSRFRGCFLLRVKGDSMKYAGIIDDDMVVVRPQTTAENGEIVAALLGNEATVKRLRKGETEVVLAPENPEFEPIVVGPDRQDFQLIGVVVGLLRNYR
ncbi:transcriptional repressor LexA [candidate division WOR-3 bacterium]|nr:transcriptional repressor LexA [candidate division WOR-3 bacterium]